MQLPGLRMSKAALQTYLAVEYTVEREQTADGERVQRELQIAEQNLRQAKEIENQQQKNIS